MYGGGYGYFGRLLRDERFAKQRSDDGQTTSFFRLVAPLWEFVGLDTAWNPDVLARGHVGVLEDPQAEHAGKAAAEAASAGRKFILLSHHQLISVCEPADFGPTLPPAGTRPRRRTADRLVGGHEHRCMGYAADRGVRFRRRIGHGGVPVLVEQDVSDPTPASDLWEERDFLEGHGDRWHRFGFAVVDLPSDRIEIRYRNDLGVQTRSETIA